MYCTFPSAPTRTLAAELSARLDALTPGGDAVTARSQAASLSRMDPEVLTPIVESRAIENCNLGERLRRLTCPTLILQGNSELGGALTDLEARWAASQIPDCTHVYLPTVGHGAHTGEAAAYSQLVPSFLEAL